jgi:hypothetical protein
MVLVSSCRTGLVGVGTRCPEGLDLKFLDISPFELNTTVSGPKLEALVADVENSHWESWYAVATTSLNVFLNCSAIDW